MIEIAEKPPATNQVLRAASGVRIKTVALPVEHGGWGLLFEPVLLGLLLAPSIAGFYLALSAVGLFLARHPLTLVVVNRQRQSPRTIFAKRFAGLYVIIGTVAFVAAVVFSQSSFLVPLLIAAPFALVQVAHDWSGRRRVLLSEMCGAIAISSLATAIALCGGWSFPVAFALWAIMIARAVPAILYVRACLDRLHGRAVSAVPMMVAHVLAVATCAVLAAGQWIPLLALVAAIVLLIRASFIFRLSKPRRVTAKQLGFSEIAFGAVTVIAFVVGRTLGL